MKAVAADDHGDVVASARVRHEVSAPASDRLEHDADAAWRQGVRRAYRAVSHDLSVVAASVVAMVPSLTAVDRRGRPIAPGLLYGDARGAPTAPSADPSASGELVGFLRWLAAEQPGAAGYWPAHAVANHALCGRAVIDGAVAFCAYPVFDGQGWDTTVAAEAGARVEQMPDVIGGTEPVGRTADGALLGPGTVDALAAQMVAGADHPGDVLVLCGATLITWVVASGWVTAPGLWTVPHTAPGLCLVGGPSNAGGLFLDWATRRAGTTRRQHPVTPGDVPVWLPYVRGERTPLYRPDLRAELYGAHLAHGPMAVQRAAYEAAGFVVRHILDRASSASVPTPRRIVAVGGGTRVAEWMQALADCTGLPVQVPAVADAGALGAAFIARCVAGLESSTIDAGGWARSTGTVEPDPTWVEPCAERYERFIALTRAAMSPSERTRDEDRTHPS